MSRKNIKKIVLSLLVFVLAIQSLGFYNVKAEIRPRQAVDIWLTGPNGRVCGYSEQTFTLNWFEDFMVDETVTITIPKKAAFLATLPTDIVYETNGVQKSVYDLEFSETDTEKKMTFKVEEPEMGSTCSATFKLRTPLSSKQMVVEAKVGDDSVPVNEFANYTSREFAVRQGLTVETTADVILKDMKFDTFGLATIKCLPPEDHYRLSMLVYDSNDSKKLVNELSWVIDSERDSKFGKIDDRDYRFTDLVFPEKYKDGFYTVRVSLSTENGDRRWNLIDYAEKEILFRKNPPQAPEIIRTPSAGNISVGQNVTINASYVDPEGVPITYEWIGRDNETQTYPVGKNIVQVRAVDAFGLQSPWAADLFFVTNADGSGGMVLTGPDSTIIEDGLEGYTIGSYVFTVPPVSGHYGNDYGRVRGLNKSGQWVQVDYGTTSNGITMSGNLPQGVYTKLEFYYYTNHTCMYEKSNITYSVKFDYANGSGGTADGSHPANTINIKNAKASMDIGEILQLTPEVLPEDTSDKTLIWSSSDPSVATISADGKITAITDGITTIKAVSKSTPSVAKSFDLEVFKPSSNIDKIPVVSVTLNKHNLILVEGQSYDLKATVSPSNATNQNIIWTSENTKIATVDANGSIKAVSGGAVNIIGASQENPSIKDICTVIVSSPLPLAETIALSDIMSSQNTLQLKKGDSVQITAAEVPMIPENATFIYNSMDNNVVNVTQDGILTAVGTGTATIKISSADMNEPVYLNIIVEQ